MIKFSLVCEQGHGFESWFGSGDAYEQQTKRGLVLCPLCQSSKVAKAIMAPAIASGRGRLIESEAVAPPASPAADPLPAPELLDERQKHVRAVIGAIRAEIVAGTVDVGDKFCEEARKIHDGESPMRPIRGEATPEQAHALIEEGVKIMPIPALPEELN